MPHLKEVFRIDSSTEAWVECRSDPGLLDFKGVDMVGVNLNGTADAAVATRQAMRLGVPEEGLILLFQLKKMPARSSYLYQAQAILLAANVHCPDLKPVVVSLSLVPRKLGSVHICCSKKYEMLSLQVLLGFCIVSLAAIWGLQITKFSVCCK